MSILSMQNKSKLKRPKWMDKHVQKKGSGPGGRPKKGFDVLTKMKRKKKENDAAYRGFLLFTMQNRAKRNVSAVSRAIGRSLSTVREYKLRHEWMERGESITAETEAMAIYRRLYFDTYGTSEIDYIKKYVVATMSVAGTTPRDVAEAVTKTIEKPKKETLFTAEVKRKHLLLIDAAIGYIAQGIKDGDIKRTLRDLPTLINLRKEISADEKSSGGRLVAESMRVRDAKVTGGDIVEAMYEDAVELTAILGALKSRGKVVHPEEEQRA